MRGRFLFAPLMATALIAGSSSADVSIGINFSAPPALIAVPSSPVVYAPSAPVNYFSYGGQYYVFNNNVWYAGPAYNGPWTVVAVNAVPPPVLAVPVRYYRAAPPAWNSWRRDAPPRWGPPPHSHGNGKHG